jgi:hypothetical protein
MENNKDESTEESAARASPYSNAPKKRFASTKEKTLPFSNWWPVFAGAVVGVILRLAFYGDADSIFSPMNSAFIYMAPFAMGAVTVYTAEKRKRRGWDYYIWAPMVASTLMVLGTMAIMIEGLICAVVIIPMIAIVGAIGGLVMGAICRLTNWPKQAVYSFAILPLLLGAVPPNEAGNNYFGVVERTVVVQASPAKIWQQIYEARDIKPEEVGHAWMYRIGVPLPLAGVTEETSSQLVRRITMGKSVYFDQVSSD